MAQQNNFGEVAFAGREIEGPYPAAVIAGMIPEWVASVLDVGCGKGAVLKILGRPGIGVDLNEASILIAREQVENCEFIAGPAKEVLPTLILRPDLIVNLGASQAIGTPSEALEYFASLLTPGKLLLFGDGIWDKTPAQSYLNFLGVKQSDLGSFEEFQQAGLSHGLRPLSAYHSTQADWDSFEDHYYETLIRWCDNNPDDPDSEPFRARMTKWREAYLTEGRGTLGFAIVLFEKV